MRALDKFMNELAYEDVTEFAVGWAREMGQPSILKLANCLRDVALSSVKRKDAVGAATSWFAIYGLITAFKLSTEIGKNG